MPKGKAKKFIDKKNSVTFHLVHRSQKDPLIADETAPQRVLVPVDDSQHSKTEKQILDTKKRKEEEQKYGIYFDDDYNYLQHLKDVNNLSVEWERVENPNRKTAQDDSVKINLPSSVFASNVEEKVGLLDKAIPVSGLQLDLDPDIVAAMDDDFDYDNPENQLEDDFFEIANVDNDDEDDDEDEDDESSIESSDVSSENMIDSDESRDEICSLTGPQHTFKDEETRSRFTEYSMSSSVMRRNDQLTLLDDKFEQLYAAYDDNEIGALDCDEIEGYVPPDSEIVLQCAMEFKKIEDDDDENIAELIKQRMKITDNECSHSEDERDVNLERIVVEAREREKWDCQSILSTYSNIYNHPKLISEPKKPEKIKVNPRTGIPKNVLDAHPGKLTAKALAQFDLQNKLTSTNYNPRSVTGTIKTSLSTLSIRPKDETPEQRRERKKNLKEYRKERRVERKANSEAFKEEKKRQEKIMLNNKQNIQGNRII